MFGYVKPFKPELRMFEFDQYRATYCGLCKQMGKGYTWFARGLLSYDMCFLALCALSLQEEKRPVKSQVCMAHPTKKKLCALPCDELSFAADVAMLMAYYKCKDNIQDTRFPLHYYLALPFLSRAHKKAAKKQPQAEKILAQMMASQAKVEADENATVDQACDSTAQALAQIGALLSNDEKQRAVLSRFGYMLGRYIYLIDALDDLDKDQKASCFNPYLKKFHCVDHQEIRPYAGEVIHLTIAQLASAYELLPIRQYKPILDNIIYLGLPHSLRYIMEKGKKQKQKEETTNE